MISARSEENPLQMCIEKHLRREGDEKMLKLMDLDQVRHQEVFMRRIMENTKFFMKHVIWLFKKNMKDYLMMKN